MLAIMISIILVAMAYAVGIGFELPEIRAWAGNELVQVFTNAMIIVALIGAIAFIEFIVLAIVASSGLSIPECRGQAPRTGRAASRRTVNGYL